MNVVKIVAETPQEALEKIHADLGPDAVVLNVRQLPAEGVKKLWANTRVEVMASAPEPLPSTEETIERLNAKIVQLEEQVLHPPEPKPEPEVWFHDVLRSDGTPFDEEEAGFLQHFLADGKPD